MQSPFLDSVTEMMRLKRYAKRTIETYIYWTKHSSISIISSIQLNAMIERLNNFYPT